MGFWDRSVKNSFDSMFDMNRDGVLDPAEQAIQLDFITRQMEEDSRSDDDDEDELDLESIDEEELDDAGFDSDDSGDDF
ncbi:MAG: hypothetical protein K6G57_03285 [Lachnospiraceae bacterium]|nr:hypothetical protein [Lachnospiraceae bacterium]